ncbi:BtuB Outer membrane cobalamin receptor protein [Burkholderiaceae bacterium]
MKKSIRLRARVISRVCAPTLSVLSLAVAASVHAQGIEINPVVISASRMEQPLSEVLSSVSVITRQDIEKSQAPTLVDLLQGESGVEYGRNGGPGAQTSIFLRGQESKSLVVLIDGVRTQADGGGFLTVTDMPLSQVERIEILRGNAGALYGDAAIGGVINIYTRQGKGTPKAYGSIGYGSKNTADMNVGFGGTSSDYGFDVSAGQKSSKGFTSMAPAFSNRVNPDRDGYSAEYFNAKISKKLNADTEIGVRFRTQTTDADYDATLNPDYSISLPTDVHRSLKKTNVGSAYLRQQVSDTWSTTFSVSDSLTSYEEFKNGLNNGRYNSHQSAFNWSNHYQASPDTAVTAGLDYVSDKHDEHNSFEFEKRTVAGYVGMTQKIHKVTLQANLRRDLITSDYRDAFGVSSLQPNATSTLLGAGYPLTSAWKVTGTVSTGFRAPSATEISNSPSLKQEEFKSKEAGLVYADQQTLGRIAYFQTITHNAIDWFQDAQEQWAVKNAGEVENKGVEASLRTRWMGHSVKLSAVTQDPKNVTGGYAPGRRAKNYGSIDISKDFLDYELGVKLFATGARPNFNEVNSDMLAGYSIWSFYASRKIDTDWTARVRLENAFDRHYVIAGGYNTPGRGIFATLQYQPK